MTSGTPADIEKSMAEEIERIFKEDLFFNSNSKEVPMRAYVHSVPIRAGGDEGIDREVPEPYAVVDATGGTIPDENSAQSVSVTVIIRVCDDGTDRQGHMDILHAINKIYKRFAADPVLGGKYAVTYPMQWAVSDEDEYPYYTGGLLLAFDVPAVEKEDPLT